MSRTTMPAWYIDMWVNAPWPVMSPMAHTPSAAPRPPAVVRDHLRRLVQADSRHAQRGQVGPAPGRDQQPLGGQRRIVQAHGELAAVVTDLPGRGPGVELDAFGAEDPLDQLAGFGLLEGHQPRRRLDHRHRRAEAGEDLG